MLRSRSDYDGPSGVQCRSENASAGCDLDDSLLRSGVDGGLQGFIPPIGRWYMELQLWNEQVKRRQWILVLRCKTSVSTAALRFGNNAIRSA